MDYQCRRRPLVAPALKYESAVPGQDRQRPCHRRASELGGTFVSGEVASAAADDGEAYSRHDHQAWDGRVGQPESW